MIRIDLHSTALDMMFGEGNVMRPYKVNQGIPAGAKLRKASVENDTLILHFAHPEIQGLRPVLIDHVDLKAEHEKLPEAPETEEPADG